MRFIEMCCTRHAFMMLVASKSLFTNTQNQVGATRVLASLAHNNAKEASLSHEITSSAIGPRFTDFEGFHFVFTYTCSFFSFLPHQQPHTHFSPCWPTLFQLYYAHSVSRLHDHFRQHEHCSHARSCCSRWWVLSQNLSLSLHDVSPRAANAWQEARLSTFTNTEKLALPLKPCTMARPKAKSSRCSPESSRATTPAPSSQSFAPALP